MQATGGPRSTRCAPTFHRLRARLRRPAQLHLQVAAALLHVAELTAEPLVFVVGTEAARSNRPRLLRPTLRSRRASAGGSGGERGRLKIAPWRDRAKYGADVRRVPGAPPQVSVQLLILKRAGAIVVERVEREVARRLVSDNAELLQREPELALVDPARLVLVKFAERVDDPVQILRERQLKLADDAGHA